MEFLRKYWIPILAGAIGIVAGYFLNVYANKQSEKKIIDALTAEIESLKNKRLNAAEQKYLADLQAQLYLLQNYSKA